MIFHKVLTEVLSMTNKLYVHFLFLKYDAVLNYITAALRALFAWCRWITNKHWYLQEPLVESLCRLQDQMKIHVKTATGGSMREYIMLNNLTWHYIIFFQYNFNFVKFNNPRKYVNIKGNAYYDKFKRNYVMRQQQKITMIHIGMFAVTSRLGLVGGEATTVIPALTRQ